MKTANLTACHIICISSHCGIENKQKNRIARSQQGSRKAQEGPCGRDEDLIRSPYDHRQLRNPFHHQVKTTTCYDIQTWK